MRSSSSTSLMQQSYPSPDCPSRHVHSYSPGEISLHSALVWQGLSQLAGSRERERERGIQIVRQREEEAHVEQAEEEQQRGLINPRLVLAGFVL